jgi:NADH-quinone oxidoreductase subunit N
MSAVQTIDYAAIAPPLVLALTALVVLVADLFIARHRRAPALAGMSALGVLLALAATVALVRGPDRTTFAFPGQGSGVAFAVDNFTLFFWALFLLVALVVLLLSSPYAAEARIPIGEYHFLVLASFMGMLVLAASRDLVTLLVALEVVSLPAFALTALRRYDGRSSEAALKFFIVSVLATTVSLYGISLVYGLTGAVDFVRVARGLEGDQPAVAAVAVVLVLVGFGFKVSAVPFHFWAPDTYQGAPVPVAAFLSTASKAAGFAGVLLLLRQALTPYADQLGILIAVLAALTMTLGNLVALRQRQAVRLLAWSSIAQAGYMLVPLAVAANATGPTLDRAVAATLAYLAIYAAMNIGAFACVLAVARSRPRVLLADFRGLVRTAPAVALALAFFLVNLAGMPPGLAGLFGKIVVFRAAIDGGLGWLAIVMAVNTVVALYYYIVWATAVFAGREEGAEPVRVVLAPSVGGALALSAAVTVLFGVAPEVVLRVAPLSALAGG